MPVSVRKGKGKRPWKIVERSGRVVGRSRTKRKAKISAAIRNRRSRRR